MSEGSGVLFRCTGRECDYETLLFPEESGQRSKWLCGYNLPDVECPECGNASTDLGDLFEDTSRGLALVEDGVISDA